MKRAAATTVFLLAGAVSAFAQTSPSQPVAPQATPSAPATDMPKNTDAPKTPTAPSMPPAGSSSSGSSMDKSGLGGPAAGANSFTENQAKSRLESSGYSNVSGLKKDDSGVWRATAQKDGKSETVTLDYQGNISTAK
jgi:hypothetical protein